MRINKRKEREEKLEIERRVFNRNVKAMTFVMRMSW